MRIILSRTNRTNIKVSRYDANILEVEAPNELATNTILEYVTQNLQQIRQLKVKDAIVQSNQNKNDNNTILNRANPIQISQKIADSNQLIEIFRHKGILHNGEFVKVVPSAEKKIQLVDKTILMPEILFADKESRKKTLKSFMKKIAIKELSYSISQFGGRASLCPQTIEIKSLKGDKWINCSNKHEKSIVIDWRAIQMPYELQKYLIIHSFAHFFESNHSKYFWNIVSNYMPNYDRCVQELPRYLFLKDVLP